MNRESKDEIGGAHIKPSARKSIHTHNSSCVYLCNRNMGRYGLNAVRARNELNGPDTEQGHDEVDNVMSKLARPASPVPVRNKKNIRRNSHDINTEYSEDDSDENDELYASANATFQQSDARSSRNVSQDTPEQRRINTSANQQTRSHSQLRQKLPKEKETTSCQFLLQMLLMLLTAGIAVFYIGYYPSEPTKMNSIYDKISFYSDIMDLGEKYKVKDTSILQVRTGVATIFEKQDTGSFIFAYNSKSNSFNPTLFNSFVEDLAATASRFLRNDSDNLYAVVDTVKLKMQTEKEFMNKYEEAVARTGVMLVKDVDNVPSEIAMAFHYYCDEYSPLVRRSAIFFTLNLAKCSNNSDPKSTHEYIEKCLAKKWSNVGEDRIGPLLTRVVNIVVDVTSVI
ncbi:uncharacterized protein LOC120637840 isoform X2 [Pararge aegeria]|nr:uncharacterized protein LOC120637840 isoform X2 [Pararge aegeria]